MTEKSKKYNDILNAAKKLFWKHGFKRISIEEICKEANVSKMTFYKYFPNKTELAKTIMDNLVTININNFRDNIHSDLPANEKVKKMLTMKLENARDISKEFLNDFYKSEETGLKQYLNDLMSKAWSEMLGEFKVAQENGMFRKDLNIDMFFAFSLKLTDIIADEKLLSLYDTPQEFIIALSDLIVYGIVPNDMKK